MPNAIGFSLRLGENTTYCYVFRHTQTLPEFKRTDRNILIFNWTHSEYDFGYPLEISSSIYRTQQIQSLLHQFYFNGPNQMESGLFTRSFRFKSSHPILLCYQKSVAFSIPVNKVQSLVPNRSGENYEYSKENLALKFDDGYRMAIEDLNDFIPHSCHQEVAINFRI